jgi:hypothetical protein
MMIDILFDRRFSRFSISSLFEAENEDSASILSVSSRAASDWCRELIKISLFAEASRDSLQLWLYTLSVKSEDCEEVPNARFVISILALSTKERIMYL